MNHQAPAGRIFRLLGACALLTGWLAAAAPAALASPATHQATGYLRLAHLSPNTPPVDVYLYSVGNPKAMVVVHHVAYGTVSTYQTVPVGDYTVAMRAAGKPSGSPPVISATVKIQAGHAYTVAGVGPASGLRLAVLHDTLTTPQGRSMVRVIQASLKEKKVTVTAGSKSLASNLAFGSVTSYVPVAPGTSDIKASGATMSASKGVGLAADTTHTIVVLDDPGHLAIDPLTDAAGSNLMPAGGAASGFGGMASRPGSSPLPWAAATAFGVLVAAAAAMRLRGRRRSWTARGSHAR
jgi:Domain of unknown function (DUF4397)